MSEKVSEASNKKQKDWKGTYYCNAGKRYFLWLFFSVGDPDPFVRGTGTDPDPNPSCSHTDVQRTEIMLAK
jgi:hypothetical protein